MWGRVKRESKEKHLDVVSSPTLPPYLLLSVLLVELEIKDHDSFLLYSVTVPARKVSKKIPAKGLFPDAKVIRGHDWVWGDQGGELTTINAFDEVIMLCSYRW